MSGARQRLMSELRALQTEKWLHIDADDLFRWRVALIVINPDSDFRGGYFRGELVFSSDYPFRPPAFRFTPPLFHPNVYPDGRLCISILHSPGDDALSGEQAGERWSPLQGVESVLLSVLLLLDNPEINSPANVDASVLYRDARPAYRVRAAAAVARAARDMPAGFTLPASPDALLQPPASASAAALSAKDDAAFWIESDDDDDDDDDLAFSASDNEDQEFVDEEDDKNEDEDEDEEDESDGL